VVNSFVRGIINPLVGAIGTKDLDSYKTCLKGPCSVDDSGNVTDGVFILWGQVLGAVLTFVITAAVVYFVFVLPLNHFMDRRARALGQARKAKMTDNELLTEIRDLLAAQAGGPDGGPTPAGAAGGPASGGPGTPGGSTSASGGTPRPGDLPT
jgi:large conductance mechanosensitive channel